MMFFKSLWCVEPPQQCTMGMYVGMMCKDL